MWWEKNALKTKNGLNLGLLNLRNALQEHAKPVLGSYTKVTITTRMRAYEIGVNSDPEKIDTKNKVTIKNKKDKTP